MVRLEVHRVDAAVLEPKGMPELVHEHRCLQVSRTVGQARAADITSASPACFDVADGQLSCRDEDVAIALPADPKGLGERRNERTGDFFPEERVANDECLCAQHRGAVRKRTVCHRAEIPVTGVFGKTVTDLRKVRLVVAQDVVPGNGRAVTVRNLLVDRAPAVPGAEVKLDVELAERVMTGVKLAASGMSGTTSPILCM